MRYGDTDLSNYGRSNSVEWPIFYRISDGIYDSHKRDGVGDRLKQDVSAEAGDKWRVSDTKKAHFYTLIAVFGSIKINCFPRPFRGR